MNKISFQNKINYSLNFNNSKIPIAYSDSNAAKFYSQSLYQKGCVYKTVLNKISFGSYTGDNNPIKKLLYITTGNSSVCEDNFTKNHISTENGGHYKKWIYAHPAELLRRAPQEAVYSIATLTKANNSSPSIPNGIYSPNYGNNWGRHANYIEINPRILAKVDNNRLSEGIFGALKLLPAVPASQNGIANCVILSQLYPSLDADGFNNRHSSLYSARLNEGISKNLVSDWMQRTDSKGQVHKLLPEEQIKTFNDLAHLRGLKAGFRMPLISEQIKIQGDYFDWNNKYHENAYINACCDAINMGFDAIFFDSAKHVGGYDWGNFYDNSKPSSVLPDYKKMQYITSEIRKRTGREDLSFIGEKGNDDTNHFKEMGLTAGTDWSRADNAESITHEAKKQAWSNDYAAGPDVSNDNDYGSLSYETRLNRLKNALLHSDCNVNDKLPVFVQMHDIWPLNYSTNTHDLMMNSRSFSAYGDAESHWNNIFAGDDASNWYRGEVNRIFSEAASK